MPIDKIDLTTNKRAWGIWRIQETEKDLHSLISTTEQIPNQLIHVNKRLEFLAGRVLIKTLAEEMGLKFQGIAKDEFGKPFLKEQLVHISLSHSFPNVAAIIDFDKSVGIDLEQPKQKLLRVAPRIMHASELDDAGSDLTKHCVYWCAKETLVKIHGKKDLTFAENLQIDPFEQNLKGQIIGNIIVNGYTEAYPLQYFVYPDFVLVFNI